MSKTLDERLRYAKAEFAKVDAALGRHPAKLPNEVVEQFRSVTAFASDIDHLLGMLCGRAAARTLLTGLEAEADADDLVQYGSARVPYQHVRLLGVQAYLATKWALADRLTGMTGRVLCTPAAGFDVSRPARLVAHFVQKERKGTTSGTLYESIRQTFGWPIGVSYALRNHFIHDGAQASGFDLFDGPTAAAGFIMSEAGWNRIEEKAKDYGVDVTHHRVGANWPKTPRDDLRNVLDVCERELDDALGVLVGSACRALVAHVGCMLGED
jgi:hypothetical protein